MEKKNKQITPTIKRGLREQYNLKIVATNRVGVNSYQFLLMDISPDIELYKTFLSL